MKTRRQNPFSRPWRSFEEEKIRKWEKLEKDYQLTGEKHVDGQTFGVKESQRQNCSSHKPNTAPATTIFISNDKHRRNFQKFQPVEKYCRGEPTRTLRLKATFNFKCFLLNFTFPPGTGIFHERMFKFPLCPFFPYVKPF